MALAINNSVIRDNIENNRLIDLSPAIRRVIAAPEFQRLRLIRQTGLTSFVFPTCEHSRFSHSLGAFATAKAFYRQLQIRALDLDLQTPGIKFDENLEDEFSIAALCHDIGHSAFSHVLERILLPDNIRNHEACTRAILESGTGVAKVIDAVSDIESVINLLTHRHANKALTDLISSAFDVDRCDYVLRDSYMAGVEYGKYDLKWLLHAIQVEVNAALRPVLLLDGPRGLDALRQFLSARRYLHRQVYYHSTVRGAEIVLKGIFDRVQDLGPIAGTRALTPPSLHPIVAGSRLNMAQFLRTTDVEVLYMVRNFAEDHPDETLKYLSRLFVDREFPKCVLDSAKISTALRERYRIREIVDPDGEVQGTLLADLDPVSTVAVTNDLREFVSRCLKNLDLPHEAAKYLVKFDPAEFVSTPPTDLLFSFGQEKVSLEDIHPDCVGFDVRSLLETFRIARFFVPRQVRDAAKNYLTERYRM